MPAGAGVSAGGELKAEERHGSVLSQAELLQHQPGQFTPAAPQVPRVKHGARDERTHCPLCWPDQTAALVLVPTETRSREGTKGQGRDLESCLGCSQLQALP